MRTKVRIKEKLRQGQAVAVASCNPGGLTADLIDYLGQFGLDGLWIECEHGGPDWLELGDFSRACDLWGMASVVRVYANDPGVIGRTLDRGVSGIVVPHVSTREAAERAVQGAKFAPVGMRGMYGGRRAHGVEDYYRTANEETLLVVLIEEAEAVGNLDEILAVEGIDVFQVAPSDLAQTMGHIGNAGHPEVQQAIEGAIRKIVGAGRVAGMVTSDDNRERYLDMGVRFVYGSILRWLGKGATAMRATVEARNV